jgi:endoglucanase
MITQGMKLTLLAGWMISTQLHAAPLGGNNDVSYAPLPPAREGAHPIALPSYQGHVKQILLINDRWIIVAVYDVPEIVHQVDVLSEGRLRQAVQDWKASEAAGRPNWTAYKLPAALYKEFLHEARTILNEKEMDVPETFRITSPTDKAYASARAPKRVTRTFVSLGGPRIPEAHEVDYAHYCIMELPEPMQENHSYTIAVADRGSATLTFDPMRAVSRAIKVNQIGYVPDAPEKIAYLGAFGYEFGPIDFSHADQFHVIRASSGETVFSGPVTLREKNPRFAINPSKPDEKDRPLLYGEDVYELDFTALQEHGDFFIHVPGVGRSWAFRHAPDAYGEAFYIAARGFYHQRAATALQKPYTVWTREKSIMHDTLYEAQLTAFPPQVEAPKGFDRFDVIGATLDKSRVKKDVIGGWYDAADWDRNQTHMVAVFDMLEAYQHAPERFGDGQLNIPESGDGIPDILNEVMWGLECWRRSQDERGGISGFIETSTHPRYNDTNYPYAFSPRTRWSSLCYAAGAAHYARLVKPFSEKQYALYKDSALRAWRFGIDPANSLGKITIEARKRRGLGDPYTLEWEEKDEYNGPFRVHAAMQLFRLTGDRSYLAGIADYAEQSSKPFVWRFSHRDYSGWMYADLARNPEQAVPEDVEAHWKAIMIAEADALVARMDDMPYRQTWPRHQDFWAGWGAFNMVNFNRCLFIAWQLTNDEKYRRALINNTDFMLGANPMGMSWTTGMGFVYPIDIQHHISEHDGIKDPVPGLTLYGLNGGPAMHYRGRELVWSAPGPDGKTVSFIKEENTHVPFHRRWSAHPGLNTAQCEFTIHETMSATLFSSAVLLPERWKPEKELLLRGPREERYLFGYWPLP